MDVAQLQKQFSDYSASLFKEVLNTPQKKFKKIMGLVKDDEC